MVYLATQACMYQLNNHCKGAEITMHRNQPVPIIFKCIFLKNTANIYYVRQHNGDPSFSTITNWILATIRNTLFQKIYPKNYHLIFNTGYWWNICVCSHLTTLIPTTIGRFRKAKGPPKVTLITQVLADLSPQYIFSLSTSVMPIKYSYFLKLSFRFKVHHSCKTQLLLTMTLPCRDIYNQCWLKFGKSQTTRQIHQTFPPPNIPTIWYHLRSTEATCRLYLKFLPALVCILLNVFVKHNYRHIT